MPIVNFLTDKNIEASDLRNSAFLIGHCGFFLFNFLNVLYLILFEGIAFGRLRQNFLSKLSLLACFTQILSCITSIHRYNINEEFGPYGLAGTGLGILAFTPFNIAYLYLFFNNRNNHRRRFIGAGIAFWIVIGIACFAMTYINWPEEAFKYFQPYVVLSSVWHIVSNIRGLRAHQKGEIRIDESIISHHVMNKVFGVCIFLEIVTSVCAAMGLPVLTYPATGMTFTICVIVMVYAGRMDSMNEDSSGSSVEGEGQESSPLVGGGEGCWPAYESIA